MVIETKIGHARIGRGFTAVIFVTILTCSLIYSNLSLNLQQLLSNSNADYTYIANDNANSSNPLPSKPKIAIMSSFVPNGDTNPPPRLEDKYFEHLVNKACYSYIWGYDFIFNTTYGFDETYPKWHWLDFGTWHRVPHLESRIRDYDWILYTDTDFIIKDIMRPLEAFLQEFELYGKTNVQLFVPVDFYKSDIFTFSAFAFMIHNSDFGLSLLKYWDMFARGICEKGNLNETASGYTWVDTDQPGLWYSMQRAYADFYPDRVPEGNYPKCNATTGQLNAIRDANQRWNNNFKKMKLIKGSTGKELAKVPDDQPFIYSSLPDGQRSGLALQLTFGVQPGFVEKNQPGAFALHQKKVDQFPDSVVNELAYCRDNYGCYAHYNELGALKIGCGDKVYL